MYVRSLSFYIVLFGYKIKVVQYVFFISQLFCWKERNKNDNKQTNKLILLSLLGNIHDQLIHIIGLVEVLGGRIDMIVLIGVKRAETRIVQIDLESIRKENSGIPQSHRYRASSFACSYIYHPHRRPPKGCYHCPPMT